MKKDLTPYLLIAALGCVLWLPGLLAKGMFMDGIYNAILAQNLAHGISTFWSPQTNDYTSPAYWNNPPLRMFTLSCFYKILGDSYVIDRIYSLACAVTQLFLLAWAWRIWANNDLEAKKYDWLPCLLFLISPLAGWCYSNNLMENTMSIFTTLSLISFLLYVRHEKSMLLLSLSGAVCVFLACLTKGPTGLFPLAIPLFFIFSAKNLPVKRLIGYTVLQIVFFVFLFGLIFSFAAPQNFLHQYITHRLAPAINPDSKPETETYIVFKEGLIMLSPFLILYLTALFIYKRNKEPSVSGNIKYALSFILSGLAASLPIAFSMVQRKFYLLPSLPVFAIGFSILILPFVKAIGKRPESLIFEKVSIILKWSCVFIILICLSVCIANKNSFARDKEMLTDIEAILPTLNGEEVLCADWPLYGEWSLRAYCTRYYNKKMYMPDKISNTKFYMTKPGMKGDKLPDNALKIYTGNTFDLYKL